MNVQPATPPQNPSQPPPGPLLQVRALSRSFGGVRAVHDVSFSVATDEVLGLMGANGAGKTTLFNLVSGAIRPDSGDVVFDGAAITGLRPDQICRRGIGRTYQIARPFPGLSVAENVTVGLLYGAPRHADGAPLRTRIDRLLETLGLSAERDQLARNLTLAKRKRLEVARALATGPRLLMLDEVMAGLTPTEAAEAVLMVRRLHAEQGLTVLIVEHNLAAMMQLCDRVVVIHHGEHISTGTPAQVIADPAVIDAYLGGAA